MSVAFTKEGDLEATAADLPDRPVSPHPNLVTAEGLAALDAALSAARAAYAACRERIAAVQAALAGDWGEEEDEPEDEAAAPAPDPDDDPF